MITQAILDLKATTPAEPENIKQPSAVTHASVEQVMQDKFPDAVKYLVIRNRSRQDQPAYSVRMTVSGQRFESKEIEKSMAVVVRDIAAYILNIEIDAPKLSSAEINMFLDKHPAAMQFALNYAARAQVKSKRTDFSAEAISGETTLPQLQKAAKRVEKRSSSHSSSAAGSSKQHKPYIEDLYSSVLGQDSSVSTSRTSSSLSLTSTNILGDDIGEHEATAILSLLNGDTELTQQDLFDFFIESEIKPNPPLVHAYKQAQSTQANHYNLPTATADTAGECSENRTLHASTKGPSFFS